MKAFKIEKGIPPPTSNGGRTRTVTMLRTMKPGDSVHLPINMRAGIGGQCQRIGMKYTTKMDEDRNGFRLWCLGWNAYDAGREYDPL